MTAMPSTQSFEEFEAFAEVLLRAPFQSKFGRLRWSELDKPGPEHHYIIDEFLSVGDKSIIGGASQSGKSFLAIHAGMSIALNRPFFGRAVLRPGLVIYQAGEGARGIKKRLRAFRGHFDVPADGDVPFELLQSKIDLYSADGDTAALIAEVKGIAAEYEVPLVAIFIDTLATAQGAADENSGRDMGAVMANIDNIQRATGAHVCLVHHLNAGGTKLRGHSSIFANIDQVISVLLDDETRVRTATLSKQKDDESGLTIKFELMSVEIGRRSIDDKPITSCVCLPVGEKDLVKAEQYAQGWSPSPTERRVITQLFEALKRHGVTSGPEHFDQFKIPMGTEIVDWSAYRAVARDLHVGDEKDEQRSSDAIRKEFERAKDRLYQNKVLGLAKPFLWWAGRPVRGFGQTFPKSDNSRTRGGNHADNQADNTRPPDDDLPF